MRNGHDIAGPLLKLAAFTTIAVVATSLLAGTMGGVGWGAQAGYRARFTDATGLLAGDDVRIAGVRVGTVDTVRVVGRGIAEISFSVDADVRLATSTRARIRYRNLVGQRYVALAEGPGGAEPLAENGLIPLAQTEPALDLTVLLNGFRPLLSALRPRDVNAFALEIIQVLQGEAGTVRSLLTHTASLTSTLADRDAVIGRVIDNLGAVLATIQSRDGELSQLIVQLQRLVSGLAADRHAIGESLTNLGQVAGATADLVREGRPALRADIAALASVTGTLAASESVVEGVLRRLPAKLRAITPTASRGTWFTLYLCQLDATPAVDRRTAPGATAGVRGAPAVPSPAASAARGGRQAGRCA